MKTGQKTGQLFVFGEGGNCGYVDRAKGSDRGDVTVEAATKIMPWMVTRNNCKGNDNHCLWFILVVILSKQYFSFCFFFLIASMIVLVYLFVCLFVRTTLMLMSLAFKQAIDNFFLKSPSVTITPPLGVLKITQGQVEENRLSADVDKASWYVTFFSASGCGPSYGSKK